MIDDEFNHIYMTDEKLREVLVDSNPQTLTVREKYDILVAYKKNGGAEGLGAEEESVIMHNGKKFKKVQIEGEEQEYHMDEIGDIYDINFQFIGHANQSDDEEDA